MREGLCGFLVALTLVGCSPENDLRLHVELDGCDEIGSESECLVEAPATLKVWVRTSAPSTVEAELDGVRAGEVVEKVQGGVRLAIDVREDSRRLEITAAAERVVGEWTLQVRHRRRAEWLAEIRQLNRGGELDHAAELLTGRLDIDAASDRAEVLSALARIELGRGDSDKASTLLGESIPWHRREGRELATAKDLALLIHLSIADKHDLSVARRALEELATDAPKLALRTYLRSYYRGYLAYASGDLRTAIVAYREAAEQAERIGSWRRVFDARQSLGFVLQRLGRVDEAIAVFEGLLRSLPEDGTAWQKARLHQNLGWIRLMARESGAVTSSPLPDLERAVVVYEDELPQRTAPRVNALLSLALARLQAGDLDQAGVELARARQLAPRPAPQERLWAAELDGRLALARGRSQEAHDYFETLERLAAASLQPDASWRAALGRAQARVALGQTSAALEAFAEAEERLDREVLAIPVHSGRGRFLASRQRATRLYVDFLLEQGRNEAAFEVARRARSRALRTLQWQDRLAHLDAADQEVWDRSIAAYQARKSALEAEVEQDWQRTDEELHGLLEERRAAAETLRQLLDRAVAAVDRFGLSEPRFSDVDDGELVLMTHPLPDGWAAFAAVSSGVATHRLGCEPTAAAREMADCLLEPFAELVDRAERIRFLPHGPFLELDLHALPWLGAPLAVHRPVSYGSDLGSERVADSRLRRALVVADPVGDLPAARQEAKEVEELLVASGWTVEYLAGTAVTGPRLRARLAEVDLVHYAGHGRFDPRGWESSLPLADGSQLTAGDLLALPRVPTWVVLSGCETGRPEEGTSAPGIGLAQAFLLAGSAEVIATVRPVDDRLARELVAAFYRAVPEVSDWSTALHRAQAAVSASNPEADWSSFRALVP